MTGESNSRRLLLIPCAPGHIRDIDEFNPGRLFADVGILNIFQDEPPHGFTRVPVVAGLPSGSADPLPEDWLSAALAFKPDCIRSCGLSTARMALQLGREMGVPVVLTADQMPVPLADLKGASQVVARNEALAERCIELGADPAKVVTVQPRVDRSHFTPKGELAPGPQGGPKLLWIGGDESGRFLLACGQVARTLPELSVVHIGTKAKAFGSAPFARHIDTAPTPAWYRWADAVICLEGTGLELGQALACGTPCIGADKTPMNRVITDNWDGLIVNAEDEASIVKAVRAVADQGTRARLAAPTRAASDVFDARRVDSRECWVYRSLFAAQWPLISVVLPTYNRASLIEGAVRNALEQDYPNLELIVVNDGSKDETGEVLARLQTARRDPRLKVISRDNGGLPTALNTGFAQARGEFWTWTSDDNLFRPGALRALARELLMDPEAGLVYADMLITDEAGNHRLFQCGPPQNVGEKSTIGLCFLYRAAVAREVGEYDPDLRLAEDYDYWLRMLRRTRFVWLPRVLYDYGDEPFSLTRTEFHSVHLMRLKLLKREFGDRPDWSDRRFEHLLRFSAMAKQYGLVGSALRTSLQAVISRPRAAVAWKALLRSLVPGPLLRLSRRVRGLKDA